MGAITQRAASDGASRHYTGFLTATESRAIREGTFAE